MEVKYNKASFFLLRKEGRQKELVTEDGLHCYNKRYDDLIRVYLYQHSPPMPKTCVSGVKWRIPVLAVKIDSKSKINFRRNCEGYYLLYRKQEQHVASQKVLTNIAATDEQHCSCCQFCNLLCMENACFDCPEQ